jgi:uncharacterized protein (TIGR02145 family)
MQSNFNSHKYKSVEQNESPKNNYYWLVILVIGIIVILAWEPIVKEFKFFKESFTSETKLASVVTSDEITVLETSAIVFGEVSDDGGAEVIEYGFCYSDSPNPETDDYIQIVGSGTGEFSIELVGLTENTLYYYRAYAVNKIGTSYGQEYTFFSNSSDLVVADIDSETDSIGTFTDSRDGQTYKWVKIGNQIWMAENLNYNSISGSWCYDDDDSKCETFGRLYDWDAAKIACPAGWHLPSEKEFNTLLQSVGGSGNNAYKALKSSGNSGFSAFFGGWRDNQGVCSGIRSYCYLWSSTMEDDTNAWSLFMNKEEQDSKMDYYDKDLGFYVRCVKD